MSFNEASAPLATLTAIDDGKILSMFVYDGSEVGRHVVRVVNRFPKVISPYGDDFLVNGMTINVGATTYTVSDVRMPKSCYEADPVQNKAFRKRLDFWQTLLKGDKEDYYGSLDRCVHWIRKFGKSRTGSREYSRIIDELLDLCQRHRFKQDMTEPDVEAAIGDLEKRFHEHGYVPPRFSSLRVTAARYLPYGKAIAQPVKASKTLFDNVSFFFESYRRYMAVRAALRANRDMAQQPLFELVNEDSRSGFLQVYEGEPFSVPCSDEVFTAHTMRGVPVIRSEPVDGRPCHCMVVEGGYFKVDPAPGRASTYAVYDSAGELQKLCARPRTLYTVFHVKKSTGIADIFCDEKEFVELGLAAYGTVAERYETVSNRSGPDTTASFIRSKLLLAHIDYAASDLKKAQAYLDEIHTHLAWVRAGNALR